MPAAASRSHRAQLVRDHPRVEVRAAACQVAPVAYARNTKAVASANRLEDEAGWEAARDLGELRQLLSRDHVEQRRLWHSVRLEEAPLRELIELRER